MPGAAKNPLTGLTPQQEAFAHALAFDGLTESDAYRKTYHPSPDCRPATIHAEASRVAANPRVASRVAALRAAVAAAVVRKRAWDVARMVEQAETHMAVALTDHPRRGPNVSAANGALEIIGRATGILTDRPREVQPAITRVVIVLNRGDDGEGHQRRIVDGDYEVIHAGGASGDEVEPILTSPESLEPPQIEP